MPGLFITFVLVSILMIALSIPLILRRVKPNYWYGFRFPQILSDPVLWYDVNAYGGRLMGFLGMLMLIVTVTTYFMPGLNGDGFALLNGVLLAVGSMVMVSLTSRYMITRLKHSKER